MSVNVLPNEILHNIFRYVNGSDVIECRRVCQRWKQAVDGLSDEFWKKICAKEHICEVYEDAYRKAGLSWRELYESLSLWADVATADVKITKIPEKHVSRFQILSNGVIAVSCREISEMNNSDSEAESETCDHDNRMNIVYYDLATKTELNRECFDFTFKKFEENNYFYILELKGLHSNENYIRVILKSNKNFIDFGREVHGTWNWVLHDNMVYLQCFQLNNHFCRIKVVKQNNDFTMEAEDIQYAEYYCRIKAVANINSEQTNIFALEGRVHKAAQIYSLIDKKMKLLCRVNTRDDEAPQTLRNHGLNLRCMPIFELFSRYSFASDNMLPDNVFYHYAKTVIIHKQVKGRKSFKIYYIPRDNPYEPNGKLNMNKAKPTKSINLAIQQSKDKRLDLEQLDVVETLNGHRIIVSFQSEILVIELNHKASDKRTILEESDEFYKNIFYTQNRLIYTTYEYHTTTNSNYAVDE